MALPSPKRSSPLRFPGLVVAFAAGLAALGACTPAVVVAVSATATSVLVGGNVQFSAAVGGTPNQAVTWRVNGVLGGSSQHGVINANGLYSAPAVRPHPFVVTVSAHSAVNAAAQGSANLTITANGQLYVSAGFTPRVAVFSDARHADGDLEPDRLLVGGATGLTNTMAVTLAAGSFWAAACNASPPAIRIWDDLAAVDGDVAPDRVLEGPATGFDGCVISMAVDEGRDLLYVLERDDLTVRVFSGLQSLDGDVAPVRSFTSVNFTDTSTDGTISLDVANDRLYLASAGNSLVEVFEGASTVEGAVEPARSIELAVPPQGMVVDPTRDILYVTGTLNHEVQSFAGASTLSGPVTADRIIAGAATGMDTPVVPLIDEETGTLYVASLYGAAVQVWHDASQVDGDVAPDRVITSVSRGLDFVWGLYFDPDR